MNSVFIPVIILLDNFKRNKKEGLQLSSDLGEEMWEGVYTQGENSSPQVTVAWVAMCVLRPALWLKNDTMQSIYFMWEKIHTPSPSPPPPHPTHTACLLSLRASQRVKSVHRSILWQRLEMSQ